MEDSFETESSPSYISKIYESDNGAVVIESSDSVLMDKQFGIRNLRPKGTTLFLRHGEDEFADEIKVPQRVLEVVPIPFFKARLRKATQEMIAYAFDIEFSEQEVT